MAKQINQAPKEADYKSREEWLEALKEYTLKVFPKDPIKAVKVLFEETA
jgi:hypothetical protein